MNGNIKYIGQTTRFTKMKNKIVENTSFRDFLVEKNLKIPSSHRMCTKNMTAGFKSAAKYDRAQPTYDPVAWQLSCEWVRYHFSPYVRASRTMTQEEVIRELDKTTSSGFPWSLEFHNKKEMLESSASSVIDWYWEYISQGNAILDPCLKEQALESELNSEMRYHPIWTCAQKVEMRPIDKLKANSIRTFTAAPIEHTVALARLCLDFNNLFYDADETWSFVGRSKFAQGWNKLIERLLKYNLGLEFDASSWDSSCFQLAMIDQLEFRWESLDPDFKTLDNRRRLVTLYEEIIWSVIVMENGELVWKNTGNPSGSGNTIVDNTMILYRVIAYCWIRACPPEKRTYSAYHDNVEGVLNGDDNDLAISETARSFFTIENIVKYAAELGVKMTTPCTTFQPIETLSFLSQNTVRMYNLWMPSPDTEKVLCSLWFGSDINDVRWHLLRASALYIDSWANLETRHILHSYIDYLCRRFKNQMVGEVNGLPMRDIFHNIKSDSWCLRLYAGYESKECYLVRA